VGGGRHGGHTVVAHEANSKVGGRIHAA